MFLFVFLAVVPFALDAESSPPEISRTLDDYRHFRVVAIDLAGRAPTRDEVATFERPDFNIDKWVDQHLTGPSYVERLTRIYMDLLRLEPNVTFQAQAAQLYRADLLGTDGKPIQVFYRTGQRRAREATDGEFCLSPDETGQIIRPAFTPLTPAKKVTKKLVDEYTVLVKPWWLYRDYRAPHPSQRLGEGWANPDPEYRPTEQLLTDPNGKPTTEVRVCREEASSLDTGHVFVSGRAKNPPPDAKLPGGRQRPAPLDSAYAVQHKGEPVTCATRMGLSYAADCGCGVGLDRCIPSAANADAAAFYYPNHMPLGPGLPLDDVRQSASRWFPYWWSREAVHFLNYVFEQDRDFREILTGHESFVNGPLAQFYRTIQRGNCCGAEATFGMTEETEPLFDPKNVPADLEPQDVGTWKLVADRGPHAAGLLTTPMFLEKYASARARGAVLYNAFLCKSFVADKAQLLPSDQPNLMLRPGCSTCHATLEPLAAYFARVEPSNFVFLPAASFPAKNPACKKDKNGHLNGACNALYDVAFADDHGAMLRSAYGAPQHADATPVGAAQDITKMPEFAQCAVDRVTSSFLGRPTTPDDEPMLRTLTDQFTKSGYRMRTLVRNIVRTDTYRKANNLSSTTWRTTGDK
jgi:hypothetical protein